MSCQARHRGRSRGRFVEDEPEQPDLQGIGLHDERFPARGTGFSRPSKRSQSVPPVGLHPDEARSSQPGFISHQSHQPPASLHLPHPSLYPSSFHPPFSNHRHFTNPFYPHPPVGPQLHQLQNIPYWHAAYNNNYNVPGTQWDFRSLAPAQTLPYDTAAFSSFDPTSGKRDHAVAPAMARGPLSSHDYDVDQRFASRLGNSTAHDLKRKRSADHINHSANRRHRLMHLDQGTTPESAINLDDYEDMPLSFRRSSLHETAQQKTGSSSNNSNRPHKTSRRDVSLVDSPMPVKREQTVEPSSRFERPMGPSDHAIRPRQLVNVQNQTSAQNLSSKLILSPSSSDESQTSLQKAQLKNSANVTEWLQHMRSQEKAMNKDKIAKETSSPHDLSALLQEASDSPAAEEAPDLVNRDGEALTSESQEQRLTSLQDLFSLEMGNQDADETRDQDTCSDTLFIPEERVDVLAPVKRPFETQSASAQSHQRDNPEKHKKRNDTELGRPANIKPSDGQNERRGREKAIDPSSSPQKHNSPGPGPRAGARSPSRARQTSDLQNERRDREETIDHSSSPQKQNSAGARAPSPSRARTVAKAPSRPPRSKTPGNAKLATVRRNVQRQQELRGPLVPEIAPSPSATVPSRPLQSIRPLETTRKDPPILNETVPKSTEEPLTEKRPPPKSRDEQKPPKEQPSGLPTPPTKPNSPELTIFQSTQRAKKAPEEKSLLERAHKQHDRHGAIRPDLIRDEDIVLWSLRRWSGMPFSKIKPLYNFLTGRSASHDTLQHRFFQLERTIRECLPDFDMEPSSTSSGPTQMHEKIRRMSEAPSQDSNSRAGQVNDDVVEFNSNGFSTHGGKQPTWSFIKCLDVNYAKANDQDEDMEEQRSTISIEDESDEQDRFHFTWQVMGRIITPPQPGKDDKNLEDFKIGLAHPSKKAAISFLKQQRKVDRRQFLYKDVIEETTSKTIQGLIEYTATTSKGVELLLYVDEGKTSFHEGTIPEDAKYWPSRQAYQIFTKVTDLFDQSDWNFDLTGDQGSQTVSSANASTSLQTGSTQQTSVQLNGEIEDNGIEGLFGDFDDVDLTTVNVQEAGSELSHPEFNQDNDDDQPGAAESTAHRPTSSKRLPAMTLPSQPLPDKPKDSTNFPEEPATSENPQASRFENTTESLANNGDVYTDIEMANKNAGLAFLVLKYQTFPALKPSSMDEIKRQKDEIDDLVQEADEAREAFVQDFEMGDKKIEVGLKVVHISGPRNIFG